MKSLVSILCLAASLSGFAGPAIALQTIERDVVYRSGDVQLGGTLFTPDTAGMSPAVILMPGSGNQSRAALLDIARAFAAQGIAALAYDKQGVGKSAGDWTRESLDDLADDALAGIRFLRTRGGTDARRIGAWGISQSGWALPRLARLDRDLAFVICITGGGATPHEVEEYGYRNRLLHAGFAEADWQAARPLVQQYMQYLATGQGREVLLEAIDAARENKWSSVVNLAGVMPSAADRGKWAWVATYDPASDIAAMHMPVLVMLGGSDPFSPSGIAALRWQEGLAIAGDAHDLVIVYPRAGHGIRTNGHDMHSAPVYAPGYMQVQFAWLREAGVLR